MVSQDSHSNPTSSILHQFLISDSIASQNHFESQHLDDYGTDIRGSSTYPHSVGVLPNILSPGQRMATSIDLVHTHSIAEGSEINHHRHLMDLLGASNETNNQAQRLSLSLGSHMLIPSVQYRQRSPSSDLINPNYFVCGEEAREACNAGVERSSHGQYFMNGAFASISSVNQSCSTSYGIEAFEWDVGYSKYLKSVQSLLEELVNVGGNAIDLSNEKYIRKLSCNGKRGSLALSSKLKAEFLNNGMSAETHELHGKIASLIALLEEVERRYEKYYHHVEELVTSFETIVGSGAGKSYTSLALQAMSRHFCNLRDAIVSQINMIRRKILQDMPKISMGLSQLSLFDGGTIQNQISLQQPGVIQSLGQTWRPIRGLPETSAAILRSWLFEHFLHPYPNDSEKLILASQTGLTKNQVSNWFINARVRLWKPMVEEMYKEEFGDSSADSDPLLARNSMTRESVTDDADE